MKTITQQIQHPLVRKSILIDIAGLALIYLIPTLAHLTQMPIYFLEPMRLMLVLALVHTNKRNAYVLAFTLPLFSFVISSHPVFIKMLMITVELALNVYLFYLYKKLMKKVFPAIVFSIISSKLIYYLMKYIVIGFGFLNSGLISTPLLIQLITTTVFSTYVYLMIKRINLNE